MMDIGSACVPQYMDGFYSITVITASSKLQGPVGKWIVKVIGHWGISRGKRQ